MGSVCRFEFGSKTKWHLCNYVRCARPFPHCPTFWACTIWCDMPLIKEYIGGEAFVFTEPNENTNPLITRNFPNLLPLFRGFSARLFDDEILINRFDIKFIGGSAIPTDSIQSG